MPKILLLDLETHGFNFKADKGFLLCGSFKELGKPGVTTKYRKNLRADPLNDKALCRELYEALKDADMIITHNGKRFDVPFLNSRLMSHGLPVLPPKVLHYDTCEVAWKRLKVSGRLDNLGKFLGCRVTKHVVDMNEWFRAAAGDPKVLKEIIHHCENDVLLLEAVYKKMRVLGFKHPNRAALTGRNETCPICGVNGHLQKRGHGVNQVSRYQKFQCTKCGSWVSGRLERIKGLQTRV